MRAQPQRLAKLPLVIFVGVAVAFAAFALYHLLPPGPYGLSGDFRVFYSASKLFWAGGDPYNLRALGVIEQQSLHYSHLAVTSGAYVNPPILAAILWPFTLLPYWIAYTAFVLMGTLLAATTIWFLSQELGWRHPGVLVSITAVCWLELLGLTEGQVDTYLLAILIGGVLLCWHKRFLAAGMLMGWFWIKPDILWPAALFMGLVLLPNKRDLAKYSVGLAVVSLAALAARPELIPTWFHHLIGFGQGVGVQPDLAGLPGLLGAAPASLGLGTGLHSWVSLTILALAAVAMLSSFFLIPRTSAWRSQDRRHQILWATSFPLAIWLLATPYVHTNDDLLLLPLFLLVIGPDAHLAEGRDALIGIGTVCALFVVWSLRVIAGPLELLLLVVLTGGIWMRRESLSTPHFAAGACLAAAVTFPTVWSLHLAPVSVTSVAALILAIAAGWRFHQSGRAPLRAPHRSQRILGQPVVR